MASVRGSSKQSDNKAVLCHLGPHSWKLLYPGCQESWLGIIVGWTPFVFDSLDIVQLHSYVEQNECVGSRMGFGWMDSWDVLILFFPPIGLSAEGKIVTLEEFKWCFLLPKVSMHYIKQPCSEHKTTVVLLFILQLMTHFSCDIQMQSGQRGWVLVPHAATSPQRTKRKKQRGRWKPRTMICPV